MRQRQTQIQKIGICFKYLHMVVPNSWTTRVFCMRDICISLSCLIVLVTKCNNMMSAQFKLKAQHGIMYSLFLR